MTASQKDENLSHVVQQTSYTHFVVALYNTSNL